MDTDVHQVVKEEAPEDRSAGVDQQDPEQFHINEEEEELWTTLEGEQLHLKEETNPARFPFTPVSIKSEDNEDKLLFSQLLHQQQIEDRDVPTSSSAEQTTAETGRGAESSRNPVLNPNEQISDSSETEVSEDDVNLNVEFLNSGPETGDGDNDSNERRSSESDVKTVNKSFSCPSHSAIRSSGCLDNKKTVRLKQNVDSYRKVQKKTKLFICDICGKHLSHNKSFNSHMKAHTGQKPFVCEFCGKSFNQKTHLNRHTRVHTGQKPFSCELCGKSFNQRTNLNTHMRVHTGQKPLACGLCGKSFNQRASLNNHMRVHTGQKPFACELCGKSFNQKASLNNHMRVHTGEKPFECQLCEKRFSDMSTLNRHMRVHTGHKPFACELCGKSFNRRTTLNSHMRVHTGHNECI
ncbi:zinc finger protein OZF [Nothobranchius furzeri]|uniref:Zinc finger protein OZF-like n=1 Tax=Nothobranchius furzeri TaxID=105023 RepID=A0A8C6VX05_NOTFU